MKRFGPSVEHRETIRRRGDASLINISLAVSRGFVSGGWADRRLARGRTDAGGPPVRALPQQGLEDVIRDRAQGDGATGVV